MEIEFFLLFIVILILSIVAWKWKLLTLSGAVAACLVGSGVTLGFDKEGLILLGIFFTTSSYLSRYKKRKKNLLEDVHEKGSRRDWAQVCANGGVAGVAGVVAYFWNDPLITLVFAISLAESNADTWASELGFLSKRAPISIKGFTRTVPGTSGAFSITGTTAGFFGSFLIACSAVLLLQVNIKMFVVICLFGFFGMVIDTWIGGFLQAKFKCIVCKRVVEKPSHCGRKATLIEGMNWLRNDAVNFISCLIAASAGLIFYVLIFF